jgi:hypothetical protein
MKSEPSVYDSMPKYEEEFSHGLVSVPQGDNPRELVPNAFSNGGDEAETMLIDSRSSSLAHVG